jgi:acetyltransferase-like isoleucine patch superfamily enzyme
MLNEKAAAQLQTDRATLQQWLSGSHSTPLLLPRREAYDVTAVLFPTTRSLIRFHVRYVLTMFAGKLPWSRVKVSVYRRLGVRIGRGVYIAPWTYFDAMFPHLIDVGDGCFIGGGCRLLTHEKTTAGFRIGIVRIGAHSVLGAFSIVRSGVSVGSGVTTGLGSVVCKDVPDGRTALGNPARVLRQENADA